VKRISIQKEESGGIPRHPPRLELSVGFFSSMSTSVAPERKIPSVEIAAGAHQINFVNEEMEPRKRVGDWVEVGVISR
jgi:hypothetical protein